MKADLPDHRKFLRLVRLLGEPAPHVLGYLQFMWRRAYQMGNPFLGDALDVEAAAIYGGEPGKFAAACLDAGFLDQTDGGFLVHDLYQHAPEWAKKRLQRNGFGPAAGRTRGGESGEAADKRPGKVTGGRTRGGESDPTAAARRTKQKEQRGENKEEKPPPQTPPPGAGLPADAGRGGEGSVPVVETKRERPRDELFDAVAEVTGSDPAVTGSHVGKVKALLLKAGPPYTPAEVREFGRRFHELCPWAGKDARTRPTLGEVEKFIGRLRAPAGPAPPPPRAGPTTRGEADTRYALDVISGALSEED